MGLLLTVDRHYRRINRQAAQMPGYAADALISQPGGCIFPYLDDNTRLSERAARPLQAGETFASDRLKIDRSFIMDIEVDASDAAIAGSVIALAGALGLDAMAEGGETAGQLDFLSAHGCAAGQGYLFSRPLWADEAALFCRPG